ncbi:MAG: response regulator transcription factor [Chthoniobacteraceae bacterium]
MIRVSLVEDDRATREGFVKLLRFAPEIVCLGAYATVAEAVQEIPRHLPDVVLMDINLGSGSGIDCVAQLKQAHPELQIVMLTTYDDSEMIFNSLRVGASGYLLKRSAAGEIVDAIREVQAGGAPMSAQIARKVVSHFQQIRQPSTEVDQLTKREREILTLLAKGLPYKQIAGQLNISPSTVHGHLHTIYHKLHVQSRTEAVVKFLGGAREG